jgi:hypothetical protein
MLHRAHCLLAAALLLLCLTPQTLYAWDGDQVHIGHSITVGENENAGSLVCIGCSIRVAGTCGDVVAIGGSIVVNGTVKGDVMAIGGGVRLGDNTSVAGDVVTLGGRLSRHPGAVVKGDISEQSGAFILAGIFLVPLLPLVVIVALVVWLVRRDHRPVPAPAGRQP